MKYRYLSIFLLVLILSVGAVCAQDNSTDESSVIAASSDDVISVDSNIDVLQDGNESDELKTFSIDDSNFNNYFDENGVMLESANISDFSVIYLGNISNKNLVFDKILTILPNNDSVLTNVGVSFIAGSDNSTFRGLTFQNTNAVTAINVYSASDVLIADNIISTSSEETNGLFAINALYANNLLISSNKITYSSKSNGTVGKYSNAVRIANSDNAVLQGNVFNINISSVDVPWNEVPAASGIWVSDPISEGIVVKDSNNITLSENIIILNTTDIVTEYGYDTVYVVDINNCNDSYFGSNYVNAIGQDYIYGLIVSGENLNITYNTIFAESKLNYANAIDIEGPADVTVENNVLGAISPTAAYAIYGAMSNGNVTAYFDNNTIGAKAYAAFGMEVSGISGNVLNNKITVTGNHTTGIASRFDALAVAGNNITVNGSGEGNQYVWDGFGVENVAIKVIKGLVIIENNNITANGKGIVASDVNLTAESNNIAVVDTGLANSYAISVSNCSYVEINENIVKYTGKTNGTYVNNALYVADSAVESIDGNTFEIAIPSVDVAWPEIPAGSGNYVRLPVSEGIVLNNDTNLVFSNNLVYLNATDVITAYGYDTIYVVDVDSDNAVVDNNIIAANGADYVYGLIISGDNFTVSNNAIQVESNNYANGIDVEGPAEGIVDSNVIALTSPISTYGIYAAMSNGNVSVDYINNTIRADSYAAFGIELGGIEATVAYNTIELNGNYTTGIAANLDSLIINDNEIIVNGSGVGNEYVWDGFGVENVAIKAINGQVAISYNNITSTGKGLFITKSNLTAERNTIAVNDNGLADSYGIYVSDSSDVLIINNGIDFTGNTNGTFINNALYVADSAIDAIEENTFDIAIPSVDVNWREIPATSGNWVSAPVSEGIVLDNVTDLSFAFNHINLNATNIITKSGYDTVYVVDVKADNAVIDNNVINAMGKDYIYGILIKGEDFTISNNNIEVESDSTYANGMDIEPVSSGVVDNNAFIIKAPDVVYGIYTAMDWYDFEYSDAIDYTNNYIEAESHAVYAMSLYGSEANIADNILVLDGNYTMGIVSMMMDDVATITGNDISANGLKDDIAKTGDMVDAQTVGIFTMSESQVHNNAVTSSGNYTVVNSASGSEITDNYLVAKELLGDESVDDTLDDSLVENNIPVANATNYNLTNDTFHLFFDLEGFLRDNITSESLTFIGEFSEVGPWITIDRPIKLLSDNATLNDISFTINSDNVTIDGFDFISENMADLIEISEANNVSIINNNFDVTGVEDDNNAVIRIIDSSNVTIDKNAIDFVVKTNETFSNSVIAAEESDNIVITNNTITADIPARPVNWTSGQVLSDVISLIETDNAYLEDNNISVVSNDQTSTYDTVYGVHITGDNATLMDNNIEVYGAPYGYGLVVAGKDFSIGGNNITVASDKDYACGIDIESNSNGLISGNNIEVDAVSSYGIYTANWGGDVQTEIFGNDITASGNSVFGLSLSGSEADVENNNITTTGNFTTGIASAVDNITICNNNIVANASNEGIPLGYDTMGIETTGVHIVRGNAIVRDNNITATGEYAVDAKGTGSVTDNYLISLNYTGDAAVDVNVGDTLVLNNTPEMQRVIIQAEDVVMYYKNGTRYVLKVTDMNGKPLANETVTLTINGATYNRVTDENGTASIAINLNPGNYTAFVSYVGTGNCTNSTIENTITVLSTIYGDDLVKMFRNESQYYATFLDGQGNPLAEGTNVTFNINGVFYTRQVNGSEGKAKLNINLEPGEYVITAYHPLNKQEYSNVITVLSTIADNDDLVKYYKNDSQYVVTILGADGKAVGAGENVTFNINGVMYTRQTNASGQAKLNINLQPGNYTITAMYNGCMVSNNIEVLPILYAEDLYKKYGTSDQFRALLLDGQGNPLSGENITFNINGVFYQRTTNADGYAALNIKLGAAKDIYIITSSYNGTSISNKIYITD